MIQKGKANVIIGGQWGSEGKGKLAGYLYYKYPFIDVAVCDFTPNAGHTYIDGFGGEHINKCLPTGSVFDTVKYAIIGPHAVIDVGRLSVEIINAKLINPKLNILIHPLACVLDKSDILAENIGLRKIASTMQGSAVAQINKIMRDPEGCHLAKDSDELKNIGVTILDTHVFVQELIKRGSTVLLETAQGFDLGLNHGHEWPYVTGRDCLVGRAMDNAGISPKLIGSIIVALRTYPIRVGNIDGGNSGPCYSDQREMSWSEISEKLGRKIIEYTTVTKRVRRVFSWSDDQAIRMCNTLMPDYAFLNFVNYFNDEEYSKCLNEIGVVLGKNGCKLKLLGNGAALQNMIEID